jgi:predicted CopG family antitoxin
MARQISVSNEVYMELSRRKGKRSFSEVIKSTIEASSDKLNRDKARNAGDRLLKLMKKGYPLGKITKSRDEWHDR